MANFISVKEALAMGDWIDYGLYIKFYVSFYTRDHQVGVGRNELPKLRYWLLDNMRGDVVYGESTTGGAGFEYLVYFSEEEDAVLFKLSKWYCEELNRKSY